jgi:YD repeat-containing protein
MPTTANLVLDATLSKAVYSSNNTDTTPSIEGWQPIKLEWQQDYTPPDTFGAQLYKGPGDQYKVVFRGTEGNFSDWAANGAYAANAMHPEWEATTRFTAMALTFIQTDARTNLAGARNSLSVTGHSQGGFEAELAARIYGLKGSALDGMGASGVFEANKAALIQQAAEQGIEVAPEGYELTDFKARVYTTVGRLGVHSSGVDVEYSPLYNGLGLLTWYLGGPLASAIFQGNLHSIGSLLEIEKARADNAFMRLITENDSNPVLTDTTRVAVNALYGGEYQLASLADVASMPPGYYETFLAVQGQLPLLGVGARVYVRPDESIYLEAQDGSRGALIKKDGSGLSWAQSGTLTETRVLGPGGSVQATLKAQHYDDGTALVETERADGVIQRQTFVPDAAGRLLPDRTTLSQISETGEALQRTYDASGRLLSQTFTRPTDNGGSVVRMVNADGSGRTTVFDAAGNVTSMREVSALDAQLEQQTVILNDVTSLINAIKSGQPLPILNSGLRLANNLDALDGAHLPGLNATTQVVGGIASLYNLANALEHGDALDQVSATANALVHVNAALQATGVGSEALNSFVQETGIGKALPYLNVLVSLKNGDYAGAAVSIVAMNVPVVGWAYAVYSLISALGDEPPEAWGIAKPVFQGDALHNAQGQLNTAVAVDVAGDSFGIQRAQVGLQAALDFLQDQVHRANTAAGREAYGLIPQRMASLTWHEGRLTDPGYAITDVDPNTGEQHYPFLRWDDDGYAFSAYPELYQVDPLDPNTRAGFLERLVISALERGTIAPVWEVQTARLQQHAGDPYAGLSETERAGRSGRLAPIDPATGERQSGQFRPVALDLDHSGNLPLVPKDAVGNDVAFDWDDSGYLKQTAWLGQGDGFLFIDRNANGKVDSGSELFSNSSVADSFKGVRSMAWVDADADGRLTSVDPVFNQLKVWQDLNGDGDNVQTLGDGTVVEDDNEIHTLAQLGISQLDYANGRFSQGSSEYAMASPELQADQNGTRVNLVQGGIFIENSDGSSRLVVTQVISAIDGTDTVQAFEDGATSGSESRGAPRAIDIAHALLLANDSANPAALTITAVMNAAHGTAALGEGERTGFVVFTPEANFHGEASFQYVTTDVLGYQRTFDVTVALASVNDDPVVTAVESAGRPVYGYRPLTYSYTQYVGYGEDAVAVPAAGTAWGDPIYAPYVETVPGAPIYGPEYLAGGGEDYYWTRDIVGYGPITYVNHDTPIAVERATTGQLQASDADGLSGFTYQKLTDGQYGRVSVNPDGSWAYEAYRPNGVAVGDVDGDLQTDYVNPDSGAVYPSSPGNGYLNNRYGGDEVSSSFLDSFTVRVSDANGGVSDQTVTVLHHGPRPLANVQSGSKKPIAIDLDGDGFAFIDVDDSNVFFDVNGDGWRRRTSWIGPQDGFLAIDRDGDGKIGSGREIAFVGDKNGAQTDLEGLTGFDTNADGRLTAADRDWAKFGVWQDANTNGLTEASEFRSLDDMGIAGIGLGSDGQFRVINGQTVHGLGTATRVDGSTMQVADVSLRWSNEIQTTSGGGATGVVTAANQQAGQTFQGTADEDLVLGTAGSDSFTTGTGDDVIMDDVGNDQVDAGEGNDLVYTGEGNDVVLLGNGDDTAYTGVGNDLVLGDYIHGAGNDLIMLEGGNDIAFGGGGDDFVSGGDGNDVISGDAGDDKLFGEIGWDVLFGKSGDDELWGLDGNDLLMGDEGNDLLVGGVGDDEMEGGAGDDIYEVDSALDKVVEKIDEGRDTVRASIGYTLADAFENLTLTGEADLQGTGNGADNVLVGNNGRNALHGMAGNDTLDGGTGADTMVGGEGDDVYVVDDVGDAVVEWSDGGADLLRSRISVALAENVENLALIGIGAIDGTGNSLDNLMVGNGAANRIDGGAGADRMAGGRGNDTYVVSDTGDQVTEADGEGHDTVESHRWSYTLSDNVESLILGAGAVQGLGNAQENTLVGNGAANMLDGAAGADLMAGGQGDDGYVVDDAGDLVQEVSNEGFDRVSASIDYVLPQHLEQLTLSGSAVRGTGNHLDNLLFGNDVANILDGRAGTDQMAGGGDDDRYVVDEANDAVTEQPGEGIDLVVSSVAFGLSAHVEHLVLSGSANVNAAGNAEDNVLVGNAGGNELAAGAGNDVLSGGVGDDVLDGGAGDDLYLYHQGEGRDVIRDTVGSDTLRLGTGMTLDSVALRTIQVGSEQRLFIAVLGTDGQETDRGIEFVLNDGGSSPIEWIEFSDGQLASVNQLMVSSRTLNGTSNADTITGDRSDDTVHAGSGADTVYGRTGHDTLYGGAQNDRLFGEGGHDKLYGETDADSLWGGAGDDLLDGGSGQDQLFGGSGNDTLRGGTDMDLLAAGDGDDLIESGTGTAVVVAGRGNDRVTTGTNADFVDAFEGDDVITALAGNDFIAAGKGNDRIDAGQDKDIIAFNRGDGADTVVTTSWQSDAVSLGGGIRYTDIALRKSGNDLVLELGQGDSMTFEGWYVDNSRLNIKTLQVVTAAEGGDYLAGSADRMNNRKVVSFNFEQLVARFNAAREANPNLIAWSASADLNAVYLSGSDAQAIGGDMAWRYATTGSYGDLDWRAIESRLAKMGAGTWQTLTVSTAVNPWTALQAGSSLIANDPQGLPSPITPMAAPTSDELVFASLEASGRRPGWLGGSPASLLS